MRGFKFSQEYIRLSFTHLDNVIATNNCIHSLEPLGCPLWMEQGMHSPIVALYRFLSHQICANVYKFLCKYLKPSLCVPISPPSWFKPLLYMLFGRRWSISPSFLDLSTVRWVHQFPIIFVEQTQSSVPPATLVRWRGEGISARCPLCRGRFSSFVRSSVPECFSLAIGFVPFFWRKFFASSSQNR